jgi:RNA-binding protein
MSLTPKQRVQLKSLAHSLKPIHQVGKDGLTETALTAIREAFSHRELLKVKVQEAAPLTAREAGEMIPERLEGVEHVQTIGRTVVLFRRHSERPEIRLPG